MTGDHKPDLLERLAHWVTDGRARVLSLLALLTLALASQIPNIRIDSAPENLLSSYEGNDQSVADAFHQSFGDTNRVVVLLVQADDVLTQQPLSYLRGLSQHFEADPAVERVDDITRLPLPRRPAPDSEPTTSDETLDDLGSGETLDDLGDGGDAGDESWRDDVSGGAMDAILDLIETAPERFPGGLAGLGPQLAELKSDAIVQGDEVTPAEVSELRRVLADAPLVQGRLISRDRKVAVVALRLKPMSARDMRHWVERAEARFADSPPPEGVSVHLGGLPYLRSQIVTNMRSDQLTLVPLTLLVCMFLLFLSFRWMPGVFLPIGAVLISAVMVLGGMAVVGEPMNVLNNIIPVLLIIIGISDSIHLIGRYREELRRDGDVVRSGHVTVRTMAVACLLTSITTAVGLASLVVSRTVMLRHFGVTAGVGVMVAYLVTITFLPGVLTWVKPPKRQFEARLGGTLEVLLMKLTARILKRPYVVLGVTSVALAGCLWAASGIRVDHALLDQFDTSDPVYVTTRLLERELDGVRPLEVMVRSSDADALMSARQLDALDEVEAWAREQPEVLAVTGPSDLLHETWRLVTNDPASRDEAFGTDKRVHALMTLLAQRDANPLRSFLGDQGRLLRIQVKVRDVGAQRTMALIDELEERVRAATTALPGVRLAYTGDAYTGSRGQEAVVRDLLSSLATAVVIIFVLLALLFRSVRLGLLSIPPNLIPLVATVAYMVARGIPLNAATAIVFSISIGLAVDGTIHVLARFREETGRGLGSNAALVRAARGTGRAIVVSGVTLMAGFGVLLFSSFVPVRHFGELIAVTVGSSLLATLVVQPALLEVAGLRPSQRKGKSTTGPNAVEATSDA
ncbi:MAG: MMPL family transporter [Deltaproteobacteria bacterium]|nr:MMPL family transporter [Deltaproteobacteria bacterium]